MPVEFILTMGACLAKTSVTTPDALLTTYEVAFRVRAIEAPFSWAGTVVVGGCVIWAEE